MATISIPRLPVIIHESPFFRNGFLSMTIVGKSGCGKTEMLANVLPGISKSIKTIVIATVVKNAPAHNAIVNYFDGHNGRRCGVCADPDKLYELTERAEDTGEVSLSKQGLLIFDDFNIGKATGKYWEFTVHAFTKLRNSGWNFIIIAQYPTMIPPVVRNCTTARVLFACPKKSALTSFTQDVAERVPDRPAYDAALRYIMEVPYTYMMVQDAPFQISVGKGSKMKPLITQRDVIIPTLRDLLSELKVSTRSELDEKTKRLQKETGNTSEYLDE